LLIRPEPKRPSHNFHVGFYQSQVRAAHIAPIYRCMNNLPPLLEIIVYDERYSVPHWRTVEAEASQAQRVAEQFLEADNKYIRVEVWLHNCRLAQIGRTL